MTPTQALFKAWCGDGFRFAAGKASTFELLFKIQSTNFKSLSLQSHIAQRLPVLSHCTGRPTNQAHIKPGPGEVSSTPGPVFVLPIECFCLPGSSCSRRVHAVHALQPVSFLAPVVECWLTGLL